jgi:beta-glucosidase
MGSVEWAGQRFGLVHVDHATQKRTPKTSVNWFRSLIADQHGRQLKDSE